MNRSRLTNVITGMKASTVRVAVAATTLLFAAAACGGSSGGSASTQPAGSSSPAASSAAPAASSPAAKAGAQMTISGFDFGQQLTVKPGEVVSVTNNDGVEHTVTADDGSSFNAPVNAKSTASFTAPTKPGTYKFHCAVHPQMHGTLVVRA